MEPNPSPAPGWGIRVHFRLGAPVVAELRVPEPITRTEAYQLAYQRAYQRVGSKRAKPCADRQPYLIELTDPQGDKTTLDLEFGEPDYVQARTTLRRRLSAAAKDVAEARAQLAEIDPGTDAQAQAQGVLSAAQERHLQLDGGYLACQMLLGLYLPNPKGPPRSFYVSKVRKALEIL